MVSKWIQSANVIIYPECCYTQGPVRLVASTVSQRVPQKSLNSTLLHGVAGWRSEFLMMARL